MLCLSVFDSCHLLLGRLQPDLPGRVLCVIFFLNSDCLNFAIVIFGSCHKLEDLSGSTFVNLPTARAVAPSFFKRALCRKSNDPGETGAGSGKALRHTRMRSPISNILDEIRRNWMRSGTKPMPLICAHCKRPKRKRGRPRKSLTCSIRPDTPICQKGFKSCGVVTRSLRNFATSNPILVTTSAIQARHGSGMLRRTNAAKRNPSLTPAAMPETSFEKRLK